MKERWQNALAAARRWAGQMSEPLFLLGLSAVAGILVADFLPAGRIIWTLLALAAGAWFVRKRSLVALHSLALTVFALTHTLNLHDPLRAETNARLAPGGALFATLTGIVTDAPDDSGGGNWHFPVALETLHADGADFPARGERLYVRLYETPVPPRYGDRVSLTGLLRRSSPVMNPGEFDFERFLYRQGLAAEFETSAEHGGVTITGHDAGNPLMAAALRAREWIARTVSYDLEDSPALAATVRAMVLGSRERTPQDIEDAFRVSGTMHIFSVSGLHVGLFAALLWFVFRSLRLPRSTAVILTLTFVFFYVFVTGLRASAWRAALMTALVLTAPLANREGSLFNGIGAAACLLLGWNTQQLFQPGFVLSFGVLLAIALLHRPLLTAAKPLYTADPFLPEVLLTRRQQASLWGKRRLCESLSVSTASTLGSLPLMIGYFRLITPAGLLANLVLVVLAFAILVCACMAMLAMLGGLTWLAAAANNMNWLLAAGSVGTAKLFAALPLGHVRVDPSRLWRGDPCEITVLALDNGGAAVHIDTPEGRHWLFDCGGRRHAGRTVRPHLERTPVNHLDGVLLTHTDAWHTGGLNALASVFPIRQLAEPATDAPEAGRLALGTGSTLTLDSETTARVLFPPPGWPAVLADDRCLVVRLECRGFRVLFVSDSGFVSEKALLESGEDLRADVLVKNRHGSDFSGLPEFLNAVQPQILVYSNSRFPETERVPEAWRERLTRRGISLMDQARTGAVILRLTRDGLSARSWLTDETRTLPARPAAPWSAIDRSGEPVIR